MRKLLVFSVAVLFCVPSAALAQAPSFGIEGGLNMAEFGGKRIVESDFRSGLNVGAFATVPVGRTVAIQPEVLFSRRGARRAAYDYSDVPADGDAPPVGSFLGERTTHDYLEIPVLLKLSPSSSGDFVRPVFFAGPSAGFLLGVKEVYDEDYEEYLNSTDFGLVVGGGLELGRLSLDARYNLGLTSIAKDYDGSFGHISGDIKNRAFTVMAGLRVF